MLETLPLVTLAYLALLLPAVVAMAICPLRWQRGLSICMATGYPVTVVGALIWIDSMAQEHGRGVPLSLAVAVSALFVASIWLMHDVKMRLAQRYGWWGSMEATKGG